VSLRGTLPFVKVSVVMLSYNHEAFIRQAVESVLEQQARFDVELIVGDDHSSDATPAILRELDGKHPGRLTLLLREENIGMGHNFADIYSRCTGDFLAILDGDDYWVTTDKLQKQVNLMLENPDAAICFGKARMEGGLKPGLLLPVEAKSQWVIDDLIRASTIPSCTALYRNYGLGPLPEWLIKLAMCDWPFHVLHALKGNVVFVDEVLAAYRVHGGGVWSQLQESVVRMREIDFFRAILQILPAPYDRVARVELIERLYDESNTAFRDGRISEAKSFFDEALSCEVPGTKLPLRRKARMTLRLARTRN
jgi:glycosyltransferase involved in cell wall biosynthesis